MSQKAGQSGRDEALEVDAPGLLCVDEHTGIVLGFYPPGPPGITMPLTDGVSVRTSVEGLES